MSAKLQSMKLNKPLSEMATTELHELIKQLFAKIELLEAENKLLKEELARTKKSRPSQR